MADVDPDDLFREPNDDAYLKKAVRVGPPLEYVAEKFGHALVAIHDLLHNVRRLKQDEALISQAIYAFRSQLTGYVALKNMMALLMPTAFSRGWNVLPGRRSMTGLVGSTSRGR